LILSTEVRISELNLTIRLIFCLGLVLLRLFLHQSVLLSEGGDFDTYRQYDILHGIQCLLFLLTRGLRLRFKKVDGSSRSSTLEGHSLEFMLPLGTNNDGFLLKLQSVGVRALLPGVFKQLSHHLGVEGVEDRQEVGSVLRLALGRNRGQVSHQLSVVLKLLEQLVNRQFCEMGNINGFDVLDL